MADLELSLDDEPGRDGAGHVLAGRDATGSDVTGSDARSDAGGPDAGGPDAAGLDLAGRRPRRGRLLAGAAVAVGTVLVAGAVLIVPRLLPDPSVPAVTVDYVPPDNASDGDRVGFDEDADGRPTGPVVVTVRVEVTATDVPAGTRGDLTVLGVTGPGVRPDDGSSALAVRAEQGSTATGPLSFSVSCDDLPDPLDPARYGVRVAYRPDGDAVTVLAAGSMATRLPLLAGQVCDGWLVRRDTTVVAVGVAPGGAGLQVTVDNRSDRVVWLQRLAARGPARDSAPPGTSVHVLPLSQNDCAVLEGMSLVRPTRATSLVIGLFGSMSQTADGAFGAASTMVLSREARAGAADAIRRLCSP